MARLLNLKKTPNKKFILKIGLIVLIAVAGFWILFKKPIKKEVTYQKNLNSAEKRNEFLDKDSDNDGLKDWEEILWKTDINNPDTDNDGAPDGEEIKLNKNPLKTGPDDSLPYDANANSFAPETLTQKIGREFLFQYFSTKKDTNLTETEQLNIINSLLLNLSSNGGKIKYELNDISVQNDNSEAKIKNYANGFARAIKPLQLIQSGELEIFIEILSNEENEQSDKIKILKTNRLLYEKTIRDLAVISAPSNYKYIHLDFLNFFNNTAQAVSKMEEIYNDPAKAIIGVKEYSLEAEKTALLFKNFKNQTIKDKIKFSPNENGYMLARDYFSKI